MGRCKICQAALVPICEYNAVLGKYAIGILAKDSIKSKRYMWEKNINFHKIAEAQGTISRVVELGLRDPLPLLVPLSEVRPHLFPRIIQ